MSSRAVSPVSVEAALRQGYLGGKALAAEIVEGVVHSAAKVHRQKPIKNPDSYLLSGVVRRVKKLLARERRIEYVGSLEEFEGLEAAQDTPGLPGLTIGFWWKNSWALWTGRRGIFS